MIIWFFKKVPGQFNWERIVFKQMVLGQLDICMFKKMALGIFLCYTLKTVHKKLPQNRSHTQL